MMGVPPIQKGERYIRCPSCGVVGWCDDGPITEDEPLPLSPCCNVRAEEHTPVKGDKFHVAIIDGAPADPAHHLGERMTLPRRPPERNAGGARESATGQLSARIATPPASFNQGVMPL